MAGIIGLAGGAAYGAIKAAMSSFTQAWAAEYSQRGVHVNAVAPGPVYTGGADRANTEALGKTTLLGRAAQPSEIAEVVGFLVSSTASAPVGPSTPSLTTAPVPTISGSAVVGATLAAAVGSWAPAPVSLTYQWKRNGTAIVGATASTYLLTAQDAVTDLTVTVTGSKPGYLTASKTSAVSKIVWAKSVTGIITSNTTWGGTGIRNYLVTEDLSVAKGVTLTIAAGTIVKFSGGSQLDVSGTLKVTGTTTQPVTFTSYADDTAGGDWNADGVDSAPALGDWRGITTYDETGSNSGSLLITGLSSRYGDGLTAVLVADSQVVRVSDSTITGGMDVWRSGDYEARLSEITLTGNTVRQGQLMVTNENAEPEVVTTVTANTVTGATNSGSAVRISDVRLSPQYFSGNTATGNGVDVIELDGTLIADWTIDAAARYVFGDIIVETGVTLTAPAGRIVKFTGSALSVAGTLVANGTSAQPVIFTSLSDDSAGGDWNADGVSTGSGSWSGISTSGPGSIVASRLSLRDSSGISADLYLDSQILRVSDSWIAGGLTVSRDAEYEARLSEITLIGNSVTGGRLAVYNNNARPEVVTTVKSNTVSGYLQRDFPVAIVGERLSMQTVAGNTVTGNTFNVVYLSGTLVTDWVIDSTAKYVVGSLTVDTGVTLTAPAGRVVKFFGQLIIGGALQVNGTPTEPVVFTSFADDSAGGDWNADAAKTTPSIGDWSSISTGDGTGSLVISNLSSRYGTGVDSSLTADAQILRVTNSTISGGLAASRSPDYEARLSEITITGNTITGGRLSVNNANAEGVVKTVVKSNTVSGDSRREYAVALHDERLSPQDISGNTVSGNTFNVVSLSGILIADWVIDGVANYVFGDVTVDFGVTLTASAGRIVKLDGGQISVYGVLRVQGTAAAPVVFTSFADDAAGGDWNADAAKTTPSAGDWGGINNASGEGSLFVNGLSARFGRGLDAELDADATALRVTNSTIGGGLSVVRVSAFEARLSEVTISGNVITGGRLLVNNSNDDTAVKTTVKNNAVSGYGLREHPINIYDVRLSAADVFGNTVSSSTFNTVRLSGNLITDWSIDSASKYVFGDVTVASTATLTAPAGRVIKFDGGTLVVEGAFVANGTTANPVVFTSFYDDTVGGDWNVDGAKTTPSTGDWGGIVASEGGTVTANGLTVKYAATALNVEGGAVSMRGKFVADGTAINSDGTFVDAQNIDWGSAAGPGPTAVTGSGVLFTPWIGYVAPPKPPQAAPQPIAAGNSSHCARFTVFGLRGSKEDPQGDYSLQFGWSYPTFGSSTDGFGDFDQQVFNAFDTYQIGSKKQVAIQYSALPVPVIDPRVAPQIYNDSIFDGVDKLIARMSAEEVDCPNTKFVVVGYSQGALAAHIAFRVLKDSDPTMLAKVVGVAFISDPGRVHNPKEAWWASASVDDEGNLSVTAPGLAESLSSGVWSPVGILPGLAGGPLPDAVAAKTVELCHNRDLVCSTFLGAGIGRHEDYSGDELNALGFMLASQVP